MTQLKDMSQKLDDLKHIYLRKLLDSKIYPSIREYLEKFDDIEKLYYTNTPESRKKAQEIINELLKKIMDGVEALFYNNNGMLDKLEKKEEITKDDIEYQLKQVEIFNLWAERQTKLYLHLIEIFREQEKEKDLEQAYRECYANNPHLLKLSSQWEKAQNEDWSNWEKQRKNNK